MSQLLPSASPGPRWRRRKVSRPEEITEAALAVFAERGYAAARLEDIAARAGLSKAALYLYFETKTELFQAVVRERASPRFDALQALTQGADQPFERVIPEILAQMAATVGRSDLRAVVKIVIGESRNFPELAQVWHDAVVSRALSALTALFARAQARGEVRPGDPRLMAMSLAAPMLMGGLWREVMEPVGGAPVDLEALAAEHVRTVLGGMITHRSETLRP